MDCIYTMKYFAENYLYVGESIEEGILPAEYPYSPLSEPFFQQLTRHH